MSHLKIIKKDATAQIYLDENEIQGVMAYKLTDNSETGQSILELTLLIETMETTLS